MLSKIWKRGLTVRKAVPSDSDFIIKCVKKMIQVIDGTKELPIIEGIDESCHKIMQDPVHYPIFIAEKKENNEIVKLGAAISNTQILLAIGGPYLYVQEMYVDDKARGKGVGAALLNHVEKYAKENGYKMVELTQPDASSKYHEERTKFYARQGYNISGISRSKEFIQI
ncbi:hypothetical protein M9Y10_036389 [Tritrichomonas musculus]|uniref:N-acetyltransferase domain-containing protein n=1 Tax=Tritrichomonas musculus TaxID=1915356 RepID=A0ABR2GLW7_9EUKA